MSGWESVPPKYRCEELTRRRGLQCMRQAMHYDTATNTFRCQQHWEMHMIEQGFKLS
jgi:hypothetical protein